MGHLRFTIFPMPSERRPVAVTYQNEISRSHQHFFEQTTGFDPVILTLAKWGRVLA